MKCFIVTEQTTVDQQVFLEQFITQSDNSIKLMEDWEEAYKDYEKVGNRQYDTGMAVIELVKVKLVSPEQYLTLKECGIQENPN